MQHFRVHKKVLCRRISFFENAIDNSVEFPEVRPESIYALLLWVYTGNLPVVSKTEKMRIQSHWNLLKVYILAHKLNVPELMAYITKQWIDQEREESNTYLLNFDLLDELYSKLPAESRPHGYISWVFCKIRRQKSGNFDSIFKEVQKLMKKHPDAKADFAKYIEEEKVWHEKKQSRATKLQKEKKNADGGVARLEDGENDNGIDYKACTEAFSG